MDASAIPVNTVASLALAQSRRAPTVAGNASPSASKKAAEDFESFFASEMLNQMFSGVKTDSLFGGGHGEEMFRSLLLDSYGKQIAKHGSLGIANSLMRTLTAQQEVGS